MYCRILLPHHPDITAQLLVLLLPVVISDSPMIPNRCFHSHGRDAHRAGKQTAYCTFVVSANPYFLEREKKERTSIL
jgi:hypothetical protein